MYRATKMFWWRLLFGMLMLLLILFLFIIGGGFKTDYFFYFFVVVLLLFYSQIMRINSYFVYKKNSKLFAVPTQYEFDDSGVKTTNEFFSCQYRWSGFIKFIVNNKVLLLYMSPQFSVIIPKVVPDEDWDVLTKLIKSKIK